MPRLLFSSYFHGALTFGAFLALSILSLNMNFGFVVALLLSAVSSWFRPCYLQFVHGAILALMFSGPVSLLVIDASVAIKIVPLLAIVSATAVLGGWLIARTLQWILARLH